MMDINPLAAIAVNMLVLFGPMALFWIIPQPPHACFATEETYEPLYTFELLL